LEVEALTVVATDTERVAAAVDVRLVVKEIDNEIEVDCVGVKEEVAGRRDVEADDDRGVGVFDLDGDCDTRVGVLERD